jgi:intracellular sulfur oxidation DsrE/DsrF family protein
MSNEEQKFSDEFINAFVDDQLTPEEKAQVYARLSGNEALNRQICELRKVRDMVQLAYKEPPLPERGMASFTAAGRKYAVGLVAGLALVIVGGMGGWFLHQPRAPQDAAVAQVMSNPEEPAKVLFHVSDGNTEHLKSVLDDVEDLMKYYRRLHQKARVEVITNGEGLSLLLAGISPFAERIQKMQKEYHGLTFVACQNTIDRYQEELGLTVKLLPGVVTIDSGVAQIMRRQHEGWVYLQV